MRSSFRVVALVGLVSALAFAAAGCGGGGNKSSGGKTTAGGGGVTALPTSACSEVFYQGSGEPDFIVASDLPLQGAGRAQTSDSWQVIFETLVHLRTSGCVEMAVSVRDCVDG